MMGSKMGKDATANLVQSADAIAKTRLLSFANELFQSRVREKCMQHHSHQW